MSTSISTAVPHAAGVPSPAAAPSWLYLSRSDRLVAAMLGLRAGGVGNARWGDPAESRDPAQPRDALEEAAERDRTRERIRLVHQVMARRRLRKQRAVGGRRLT